VRVATLGEEIMSPALEMSGLPQAAPAEVQVTGAAPLVSRVDHVRADISVGDAAGVLQRVRPVIPVDENENRISGLTVRPEQVQVTVDIVRRADARVVGVRVRTEGELPAGYRLSDLGVSPAQVTLLGPREQLADLEAAIFTFPVNISTAVDDLRIQAALELPPGVEALNNIGEPVRSVVVTIEVEPQMANWVRQRTVEIQGELAQSFTISPAEVDVFLNGPVPILEDIDASPRLLQLVVDAADLEGLEPGESIQLTPRIIHPDELRVRVQPDTVTITAR
jgi:YbbR domain-containing protein